MTYYSNEIESDISYENESNKGDSKAQNIAYEDNNSEPILVEQQQDVIVAECKANRGQHFLHLAEYGKAIEHFTTSMDIFLKIGRFIDVARLCSNLFICYANLEDDEKTIIYGDKALKYALLANARKLYFRIVSNFCIYYSTKNKFEKAYLTQKEAIEHFSNNSKPIYLYYSRFNMLDFKWHFSDIDETIVEIHQLLVEIDLNINLKAMTELQQIEYFKAHYKANQTLSDIYEYIEDYHKALEYQRLATEFQIKHKIAEMDFLHNSLKNNYSNLPVKDKKDKIVKTNFQTTKNDDVNLCEKIKKLEKDNKRLSHKIDESYEAKKRFIHNIGHEFKTPLNAIIGFSKLAISLENDKSKTYLEYVINSAEQLESLVDSLLETKLISQNGIKVFKQKVSLKEIKDFAQKSLLILNNKKNLVLEILFTDNLPPVIYTDKKLLKKVFISLYENAKKYTVKGKITITFDYEDEHFIFSIEDTGRGIPQDKLEKIFHSFEQIENETTIKNTGMGVGLLITKKIIEALDGTITVTSTLGKGSKFIVSFPVNIDDDKSSNKKQIELKPMKILVVEDILLNQKLLKNILLRMGMEVEVAANGKIALDYLGDHDVDIILMDIQMPIMDGFQTVEAIRKDSRIASIPIIAQTALTDTTDKIGCLNRGFDDYITKPINCGLLKEKLSFFSMLVKNYKE